MKRVAIAVLGAAAGLAAGCGGIIRTSTALQTTVPWEGFQRIEVQVVNGRIEIASGGTEKVRISCEKSIAGATQPEAERNLERVELYAGAGEQPGTLLVELRYPDELKSKSPAANVVIQVPTPCAAKVKSSNGAISVAGLEGGVTLETSNGRIHATDIKGPLSANTSNGRIEVATISGDLTVRTSNGEIIARDVTGPCTLTTSNGAIRLTGAPPPDAKVDLSTTNGAIHATLPKDWATELKLKTSNGHLRVALGTAQLTNVQSSRNSYHATVNGGGGTVSAETSNGAITVDAR